MSGGGEHTATWVLTRRGCEEGAQWHGRSQTKQHKGHSTERHRVVRRTLGEETSKEWMCRRDDRLQGVADQIQRKGLSLWR